MPLTLQDGTKGSYFCMFPAGLGTNCIRFSRKVRNTDDVAHRDPKGHPGDDFN
jgi:hypothetical protein